MTRTKAELARIFSELGANDPEGWAASEVEEGIAQLGRFLFLRGAWRQVVDPGSAWQDNWIAGDGEGPAALRRLIEDGVNRDDLTSAIRSAQCETLFGICYLLSDPSIATEDLPEGLRSELESEGWVLVEEDYQSGDTGRAIGGLHESALEMDPNLR